MKAKWICLSSMLVLVLAAFAASVPQGTVRAQSGENMVYLPIIYKPVPQTLWFDDFEDLDPPWPFWYAKNDPKDGWFEHRGGRLVGEIRDNSALVIASPGWRASGDFELEVDGVFTNEGTLDCPSEEKDCFKTLNTWGLVFGGKDDWTDFYVLLIADGGAQHYWVVQRWVATLQPDGGIKFDARDLTNDGLRGGPLFLRGWDEWNRVKIVRQGTTIKAYGWDWGQHKYIYLPGGTVYGATFGGDLVGVMFGSWEIDQGQVQFDNFRLQLTNVP